MSIKYTPSIEKSIKYIPLKKVSPLLEFSYVGVIPYVIIDEEAYPFFGVNEKIPTLCDFGLERTTSDLIPILASRMS